MRDRKLIALLVIGLAAIVLGAILVACAAGPTQEEHEAVKKQLAEKEKAVSTLQQQLAAQAAAPAAVDLKGKPGTIGTLTVLQGVEPRPTPTPRPAPTPEPPGTTPAPPRTSPAVYDQPVPFSLYVETLITGTVSKYGYGSFPSCVPASVFKRGSKLVWRFEIFDTKTGVRLNDRSDPTVKIKLPHGEQLTGRFSQRAGGRVPDAPWMWNAAWDIPPDYPVGALDYQILITAKDGRSFTWTTPALVFPPDTDSRVRIID